MGRSEWNRLDAGGSVPPPACGGLCRPGGRRSRACATSRQVGSPPRGGPSGRRGVRPAAPPAAGLCRPGGRRSRACATSRQVGSQPRGGPSGRWGAVPPPRLRRGCAGLEAGVPVPLRHRGWWGPRREGHHSDAGGSVPPPRLRRGCAGLETGGQSSRWGPLSLPSEDPGEFGEEGAVVDEFVVELGGAFLVGELE